MNCIHCGAELMDGAKFCAMCGKKVEDVCPACGAKKMEGARFCVMCGEAFESAAPKAAAPKKAKAAPVVNRAPSLPGSMRPSYSNFQMFANWAAGTNRRIVGNPTEHFIRDYYQVYRVDSKGTDAALLENIPFRVEYMFWADGTLFLTEDDSSQKVYKIYAYDTEANTCELVTDLSKVAREWYLDNPFVTASSIFLTAQHGSSADGTWEHILLRVDRKTGELSTLYKAGCEITILGVDDKKVWLRDQIDEKDVSLLVDHNGKTTPIYKHPDIKPLLPLMLKQLDKMHYERKHCDSVAEYEEGMARICSNHIHYIDFDQRRVYFGDEPQWWGFNNKTKAYWVPFGAADESDIHTYWQPLTDFSRASRNAKISPCTRWNTMMLFDGQHAVGQGDGETNFDWCYQTANGAMIDLGDFDRCENDFAKLGNALYVYGYAYQAGGSCWSRFTLTDTGAERVFIKLNK